jgi:hypothetical protein
LLNGVGEADILLDSYEAERRPVARKALKAAAQRLHLAFDNGRIKTPIKNLAVGAFGNMPAVQEKLQIELSQTEIVYREGPLVGLGVPPRKPKRTDVGARGRDAVFVEETSAARWRLWPLLSELHHSLLLFEDVSHSILVDGITMGIEGRLAGRSCRGRRITR